MNSKYVTGKLAVFPPQPLVRSGAFFPVSRAKSRLYRKPPPMRGCLEKPANLICIASGQSPSQPGRLGSSFQKRTQSPGMM